jgi:low temperature requirement protein LtrA
MIPDAALSSSHSPPRVGSAMRARSPNEPHRAATPLELLFDLVFVVAIAQAAAAFHHSIADQHAAEGLVGFLMVFFGIWWAWMNFTWFASAYDCDDVPYRVMVFAQITGALIFAAGVKQLFETHDMNIGTIAGYIIMRFAQVGQWIRAGRSDPGHRRTAFRYAIGITLVQIAWIVGFLGPASWSTVAFLTCGPAELFVPAWAERAGATTWHPHHISERYGLLTIIVLGESILAATLAVQAAIESGERVIVLAPIIIGGLLIVYAMWWLYFYRPIHDLLRRDSLRRTFIWGYGHFAVFTAAAAVGAGLSVAVDVASHHAKIGAFGAAMAVAIPAAIYVGALWVLHHRPSSGSPAALAPFTIGFILLTPFAGLPAIPLIGAALAVLLWLKIARYEREIGGH